MALVASVLVIAGQAPASASTVVTTESALRDAWANPELESIVLGSDVALESCQPLVRDLASDVEVDGGGHSIRQACAPRVLESNGTGKVALRDLTVVGGGAATSSPAVYTAALELERVTILDAPGEAVRTSGKVRAVETTIRGSRDVAIVTWAQPTPPAGEASLVCDRCRIVGNGGEGLRTRTVGARIDVTRSEITDNAGTGIDSAGSTRVDGSTVARNGGRGIDAVDDAYIAVSTIADNVGDGVRVWNRSSVMDARLTAVASTVTGNGGYNLLSARGVWVRMSVVTRAGVANCSGSMPLGTVSFADDSSCGLYGGSVQDPTGDARLGRLAYNGGHSSTMRPLRGSPLIDAVDAADCEVIVDTYGLDRDQRGVQRGPTGQPCDIGAVEVGAFDGDGCPWHFTDVGASHPFCREIDWMAGNGYSTGWSDGTYRPGLDISRQALAAFLWRLAGSPESGTGQVFSDVPVGHPFAGAIGWMAEEGISEGYGDGTFRPDAPITRQALAAMLWRLAGSPTPSASWAPIFSDVPIGHVFQRPIAWLVEVEISQGYQDGGFRPTANTTRQAMAAFLERFEGVHLVVR